MSQSGTPAARRRPARWETEVKAGGRIDVGGYALVRTLLGLSGTKGSGQLRVRVRDLEVEIFLRAGQVAHMTGAPVGHRLGDLLVDEGDVSRLELERAIDAAAPGSFVGAVAVDAGMVSGTVLRRVLRNQVARRIVALLGMGSGTWRWSPDAIAPPRIPTARLTPDTIVSTIVADAVASGHAQREVVRLRDQPCQVTTRMEHLAANAKGSGAWPAVAARRPTTVGEAMMAVPQAARYEVLFEMLTLGALDIHDAHLALVPVSEAPAPTRRMPPPPRSRVGRPPVPPQTESTSFTRTGTARRQPAPKKSSGDWQTALGRVQDGLRLDPSDQRLRAERAWIVSHLPHSDPDRRDRVCLSQLEVVTDCEPTMAQAWEYLGQLLIRMGRDLDGQRALQKAASIDPWAD